MHIFCFKIYLGFLRNTATYGVAGISYLAAYCDTTIVSAIQEGKWKMYFRDLEQNAGRVNGIIQL